MSINWTDSRKRRRLKETLRAVYPSTIDLEIFVEDYLNENLADITDEGSLEKDVHKLVKWAQAKGKLDELSDTFYQQNTDNKQVIALKLELESNVLDHTLDATDQPKINKALTDQDWDTLFEQFTEKHRFNVCQAFLDGYQACFTYSFQKACPGQTPQNIGQVYALLARFDDPSLAVKFVDNAIAKIKASEQDTPEQLAALAAWRKSIAKTYKVPPESVKSDSPSERQGYLLVTLEYFGQKTSHQGSSVNVFSELRVTGEERPIPFDNFSGKCPLKQVEKSLSDLIKNAEQAVAVAPYNCSKIILELFLPCVHLEENVAAWEVSNEENSSRLLGTHRPFVIRSYERAKNPTSQNLIRQKWQCLNETATDDLCDKFHPQKKCPSKGVLEVPLDEALGLKLCAELPTEPNERRGILEDIINAAVPIALWFSEGNGFTPEEKDAQLNKLLKMDCCADFAALAKTWRKLREDTEKKEWKHLKLLCDCPDRWPRLPDNTQEDDSLVSSY